MFQYLQDMFTSTRTADRRPSTTSSLTPGGIDIYVGKSPHGRTVHVPKSALKSNAVLRRQLSQGVNIVNTDPKVFEIALEYLERTSLRGRLQLSSQNPHDKLTGGDDMLLNLAKAWHLGGMLDLAHMQNKLIDTFTTCYRRLLESEERMIPCREPFEYLRNHIGYHSRCEKFLVDFYAGLARYSGEFRSKELKELPEDIARELQLTRTIIVFYPWNDRIVQGDSCFKVSSYDNTRPVTLQVSMPHAHSAATPLAPSSSELVRSRSRSLSWTTYFTGRRPTVSSRRHRARLSRPLSTEMRRDPSETVFRVLEPALQAPFWPASYRSRASSRSSTTTIFSARAPAMDTGTTSRRGLGRTALEDELTEESLRYNHLVLKRRWRQDSHQVDERSEVRD